MNDVEQKTISCLNRADREWRSRRVIIRTLHLKKAYVKKTIVTHALCGVAAESTPESLSPSWTLRLGQKHFFFNMIGGWTPHQRTGVH